MGFRVDVEFVTDYTVELSLKLSPTQSVVFGKLVLHFEIQLDKNRTLDTPYGRKRTFYDHWGDDLFKEATAYVPQSTSVDYLNRGMLAVYRKLVVPGFHQLRLLHQQHDSIVVEYEEGKRDFVLPAIIELLEDTVEIKGAQFSIPIETKYGPRWGKEMKEYAEAA